MDYDQARVFVRQFYNHIYFSLPFSKPTSGQCYPVYALGTTASLMPRGAHPPCRFSPLALTVACASAHPTIAPALLSPQTRAEQSAYTATSTYADVQAFLDTLRAHGAPVAFGSIGTTSQGRAIPYIIASRPLVTTPEEARALHRPIVYVNANTHAGEVEGKEAILALVRDLVSQTHPNVLDSVVLIAVPIYNADGNEAFAPQAVNRDEQFGPAMVGIRANGQGLDLNRDYMKAEAPETRGALAMFVKWEPDVYVDLHTTDGSYHGFALTYAPPLPPEAYLPGAAGAFTRDTLIPEIRRTMQARGFPTFDYGNFSTSDDNGETTTLADSVKHGWASFDHRPRFGTNYYGLRGHVAILSEAYSHDPFQRRVASTYAFVSEILSAVAKHAGQVLQDTGAMASRVPVRAQLTTHPIDAELPVEVLRRTGDSSVTQPGVPPGFLRTGRFITEQMPVYDRFEPTLFVDVPKAYLIPPGLLGRDRRPTPPWYYVAPRDAWDALGRGVRDRFRHSLRNRVPGASADPPLRPLAYDDANGCSGGDAGGCDWPPWSSRRVSARPGVG